MRLFSCGMALVFVPTLFFIGSGGEGESMARWDCFNKCFPHSCYCLYLHDPFFCKNAVILRLLFIPMFLFCNYIPAKHRAYYVLVDNQWSFIVLVSLMSITHGYFSSLSMMYAPKVVEQAKSRIVGMMSAFFLILGITFGCSFTFLESYLFSVN